MFVLDPDFYLSWITNLGSRIPDPSTATIEERENFILLPHISQTENYFIFKWIKKKIFIVPVLFTQKIVTNLSKVWGWDPRSMN
jgi:hypothetical protein